MQYNGGKCRIAKAIAPIIRSAIGDRRATCWEPFCGGLGMTEQLLPDVASDIHPGVINLYNGGLEWAEANLGNFECSEADYNAAKSLAEDDPLKAFIGFGCSFGGKWFGGYGRRKITKVNPNSVSRVSYNSLRRKLIACAGVSFYCVSFFDVEPVADWVLYLDPPYRGTALAGANKHFDSSAFADRCEQWALAGSTVFVSEYDFPLGEIVWRGTPQCLLGAGLATGQSGKIGEGREEILFKLG